MSLPRTPEQLRADWSAEERRPFTGWDLSYLAERRVTMRPPATWDYTAAVTRAAQASSSMVDMDTGGGEFLAALPVHAPRTVATEGYAPNVAVAQRRLAPLGIAVVKVADDHGLPFAAASFDLVHNRHGAYVPADVRHVLRPGGRFITQQVGSDTNRELHELLGDVPPDGTWRLARAVEELAAAGFELLEQREELAITRYLDVGAIVYYLKAVAWEIPDFTVDRYFKQLVDIDRRIHADGYVDVTFHQFFITALRH